MSDVTNAIKQICEEKNLSYEAVIGTIESALAAAYRKDFGEKNQNIKVEFADEVENSEVFDVKTVVEDVTEETEEGTKNESGEDGEEKKKEEEEVRKLNPKTEIQLSEAVLIKKSYKIGDEIKTKLNVPATYGRMAAQTAKQVIIQRLREAEREMIFKDFKEKENEVVTAVVQRREGRVVLIDLGKSVGVLPPSGQIPKESYETGDRIKVFVKEVVLKAKGPEIILSRTSDEILKKVFYLEIPEIANGLIDIKNVAREAGSRSKIAVYTDSDNIDPIGSCVGQRGSRIQVIISELGGEKVDIVEWNEDPKLFISNALSPSKIVNIEIDEELRKATVFVSSDQLSLAIGKGGQNARLAAKLTGWKIDIVEQKDENENGAETEAENNEDNEEDTSEANDEKKEDDKKVESKIEEVTK